MTRPPTTSIRSINYLLSSLSGDDFGLIGPSLEPVVAAVRHKIEESNKPIKHVYFPESGIISVVAVIGGDLQAEVGIIGREGMTGHAVIMGDDRSPHAVYAQVSGHGQRIAASALRDAMDASSSLHRSFLRFVEAFMVQIAKTAVANGRARLEVRLARWLLMAHDRLDGNELPLTHEFLGLMLGVRRAGVTTTMHRLEQRGLIKATRGSILVRNRNGLKKIAGGLYGIPEAEYHRLTGWKIDRQA